MMIHIVASFKKLNSWPVPSFVKIYLLCFPNTFIRIKLTLWSKIILAQFRLYIPCIYELNYLLLSLRCAARSGWGRAAEDLKFRCGSELRLIRLVIWYAGKMLLAPLSTEFGEKVSPLPVPNWTRSLTRSAQSARTPPPFCNKINSNNFGNLISNRIHYICCSYAYKLPFWLHSPLPNALRQYGH